MEKYLFFINFPQDESEGVSLLKRAPTGKSPEWDFGGFLTHDSADAAAELHNQGGD